MRNGKSRKGAYGSQRRIRWLQSYKHPVNQQSPDASRRSASLEFRLFLAAQFLLPPQDPRDIAFFLCFFDSALRLVEHRQAGVGEDVIWIDFDKFFGGRDRVIQTAAVEQGHAYAVQGVLILGVD